MHIGIVEDNVNQQKELVKFLTQYGDVNSLDITCECFNDGVQIVDNYQGNLDIIYLDIEMEYMDGMTAARKIREVDQDVFIVFVTNHVQFAIEGYSVNATDFMLKPLSYFSFSEHLKKITSTSLIEKNKKHSISIKTTTGIRKIDLDELLFVESEGHYIHFKTIKSQYYIWESMKNMEQKLKGYNFFRCNKSYLVNLQHVEGIENEQVIIGNERLKISRPRKKDFLKALANYLGGD